MPDDSRPRPSARHRPVRTASAAAVVACVLASCAGQGADRPDSAQDRISKESPRPTETQRPDRDPPAPAATTPTREGDLRLPETPSTRLGAAAFARQLQRASAAVRDRRTPADRASQAGEFHQLAVRTLATAPEGFRRRVLAALGPRTARATRHDVRAARALDAMGGPAPRLPRWRIVAPPAPDKLLRYYREAQRRTGVPWTYLAAIHLVETRMGRIRGTSTAGARGPMQFLPATWELYGAGGDIDDPRDAIAAAARLLKRHGAPRDMAGALWHYNQSGNYVRAVTEYARTMARSSAAYFGYWHWRVLYQHRRGTFVLPEGYPRARAELVDRHGR